MNRPRPLTLSIPVALTLALFAVIFLSSDLADSPLKSGYRENFAPGSYQNVPLPISSGASSYDITSSKNPYFTQAVIDPLDVKVGDIQKMIVRVKDDAGVSSVEAVIEQDSAITTVPLKLDGDSKDGFWYGEWEVFDTHSRVYHTTFIAVNSGGEKNSITMAWSDPCTLSSSGTTSTLSSDCTASSTVDGVDDASLDLNGHTLTISGATTTFAWNPGKSVILNGSIVIQNGAQLKKTNLWALDSDGDGYWSSSSTLVAQSSNPDGWWDTSFQKRIKIIFSGASTIEDQANFPVLVNLNLGRINYSDLQSAGQDIRFVDSDDSTQLNHEIEKWDTSGISTVWVKVPQVASTTTDFIYMYYGSSTAADAQATTSVWNSNFAGVWHLKETATSTAKYVKDSTANAMNGSSTSPSYPTPTLTGQIDGAQSFDGSNDKISTLLIQTSPISITAWIKPITFGGASKGRIVVDNGKFLFSVDNSNVVNGLHFSANNSNVVTSNPNVITLNTWQFVAVSFNGTTASFYVNGVNQANKNPTVGGTNSNVSIGGDLAANTRQFNGLIDEIRISSSTRSAAWIWNEYKAGTDTLNTYGAVGSYSDGGGSAYIRLYTATSSGDCYDTNLHVFPGQAGYFTAERGDGSFDYNCDSLATQQYSDVGSCSCSVTCDVTAIGWNGSVPACGVSGNYMPSAGSFATCGSATVQACR